MLDKPIDFNLWRAPTDNDAPIADKWKLERLDHTVTRAYEVKAAEASITGSKNAGAVTLLVRQSVGAMSNQPILRMENRVTVYPDGRILLDISAVKDPEVLTLPRIGLRLFLVSGMKNVSYFGMGPGETYIDKHHSGCHGCLILHRPSPLTPPFIRRRNWRASGTITSSSPAEALSCASTTKWPVSGPRAVARISCQNTEFPTTLITSPSC